MSAPSLRVLDAGVPEERAAWLDLWRRWPGREVQAHPDYVRLFARPADRALAATRGPGGPDAGVLYPFILRPLAAEAWAADDEPARDLVTPYGYGGPFAWGAAREDAPAFWDDFEGWAAAQQVATSFARLSLFPDQLLAWRGEIADRMPNVVRSLDLAPEALWMDYAHKVRKNVKRARREGLEVELDEAGARLEGFLEIYYATMDRRDAARGYYFPREFFEAIVRDLRGHYLFVHVLDQGLLVSTELVLCSARHLYSFLGGTLPEAFPKRANDLLKHAVHTWGPGAGKAAYVLGGGYGGPDGIFRYKLSFAPGGEVSFRVATATHDPAAVERLVAARRAHEGPEWSPGESWFPPYRA